MPYAVRSGVAGLRDVLSRLGGLKRSARNRVARQAVAAGARAVARAAKKNAPRETGLLKKSLGSKVKVYANSGVAVGVAGPRVGMRQTVVRKKNKARPTPVLSDPAKYAHLAELGTSRSAARPFLRPALEGGQAAAAMLAAAERGAAAALARGK
jgi:HK97 gp10 family phage protein